MIKQYLCGIKGLQPDQYTTIIWQIYVSQSTKVPKVANACSYSKDSWSLLIKRLSVKINLKPLLLLAGTEKSSKPDEWFQDKWCSFMTESLSSFILFPARVEYLRCSDILTLKWCLRIICSIAAIEFANNARTHENRNFIFECEKINQLVLSLEHSLKLV